MSRFVSLPLLNVFSLPVSFQLFSKHFKASQSMVLFFNKMGGLYYISQCNKLS